MEARVLIRSQELVIAQPLKSLGDSSRTGILTAHALFSCTSDTYALLDVPDVYTWEQKLSVQGDSFHIRHFLAV